MGSLPNDYPLFAFSGTLRSRIDALEAVGVEKNWMQRRAVAAIASLCRSRSARLPEDSQQRQITQAVVAPRSFWYKAALFSRGPVPSL
ncbi:hypothetical protein HNO91_14260 [Pseudomonas corrugata]|uniref:Uncharacterized protein n=1 Tax=Pseudomonas corrugata TaxID=47879 RepID=A0A7Y5Z6C4_9PSED|nr:MULTISPECIES: hypothetical protein [Pseudomonas]MCI0993172.1 hypothetical protein [Pseudomonas corrugata]MDU9024661.1 hypothetical protein [Pseudomonas corrugata]NUT65342.1 hypothetical protein [Pseudomonas corrugata]NUT87594.1 hypothetical protein [Pseudomonas corrugata]TNF85400.1 hypothetical protein FGE05_02030 [Pseudomonas sp. ICMP22404]